MKKVIKKILLTILVIFLLLTVLPIAYFFIYGFFLRGNISEEKVNYLNANSIILPPECTISDTTLFAEVNTPTVFMFGEIHGFTKTQLFDAQLLIYLNKKFGVTDYFNEFFTEDAELLNRYLNAGTPDETLLKQHFNNLKENIPQRQTQEYLEKWKILYNYNQTLPKDQKIRVYGLLGKQEAFKHNRDSVMMSNFDSTIKQLDSVTDTKRNYYCSLGSGHIYQEKYNGRKCFAALLKQKDYMVISVMHRPFDSEMYLPKGLGMPTSSNEMISWANCDGPIFYFSNAENFKEASENPSIVLYKLNSKDSPYAHCQDVVGFKSPISFLMGKITPEEGKYTTDYFQYVLVTRGWKGPKLP